MKVEFAFECDWPSIFRWRKDPEIQFTFLNFNLLDDRMFETLTLTFGVLGFNFGVTLVFNEEIWEETMRVLQEEYEHLKAEKAKREKESKD